MTKIRLGLALSLAVITLCGSMLIAPAKAMASVYRWQHLPQVEYLLDPVLREQTWRPLLIHVEQKIAVNRNNSVSVLRVLVNEFYRGLTSMQSEPDFSRTIDALNLLRADLPIELRWVLAAIEIKNHLIHSETLNDARSALEELVLLDGFELGRHGLAGVPNTRLYFKDFRRDMSIALDSDEMLIDLYRNWQQLRVLDPKALPQPEFESLMNAWFRALDRLSLRVPIEKMSDALGDLDNPEMRRFTSEQQREQFMRYAGYFIQKLNRNVRNGWDGSRQSIEATAKTRAMIGEWMISNLDYTVSNFSLISSLAITSPEDLVLGRRFSSEQIEMMQSEVKKRSFTIEPTLLADLIVANAKEERTDISVVTPTIVRTFNMLAQGQLRQSWVDFDKTDYRLTLSLERYQEYIPLIYTICETKVKINNMIAKSFVTYATVGEYNSLWATLETRRLKLALETLGEDAFINLALPTVVSGEYRTVWQRMFLSEFLTHNVSREKALEFSLNLKTKAGLKMGMKEQKTIKIWEANQGELAKMVYSLNPDDQDLVAYLVDSVVTNRVEGPIGGYSALRFLAGGKSRPETLRQALLARTSRLENGDISGNFLALVRVFPEEGAAIAKVIFNARVDKKLLVNLLKILVEEALNNDQLPVSIEKGLHLIKDATVARATYQGLTLEAWLRKQLQARDQTVSGAAPCAPLLSKKENQP